MSRNHTVNIEDLEEYFVQETIVSNGTKVLTLKVHPYIHRVHYILLDKRNYNFSREFSITEFAEAIEAYNEL